MGRCLYTGFQQKAKIPWRQVPLCARKAIVPIRGRTITGGNGGRQSLLPYHERLGVASLSTSSEHGESSRFRDERPLSIMKRKVRIIATVEETACERILNGDRTRGVLLWNEDGVLFDE